MTVLDFEQALYTAATETVEFVTSYTGEAARLYAAGIIDGARLRGARIESTEDAGATVLRTVQAAVIRLEAVGL
jgi:hypothetical protein